MEQRPTQQVQRTQKEVLWFIGFPGSDQRGADARPYLLRACQGNETLERIVNDMMYQGSKEAEKQGLTPGECEEITIYCTQQQILDRLSKVLKICKRTLRNFFAEAQARGFFSVPRYGRGYTVKFKATTQLIANPPAPFERTPGSSFFQSKPQTKSGKSANVANRAKECSKSVDQESQQSGMNEECGKSANVANLSLADYDALLPLLQSAIEAALETKLALLPHYLADVPQKLADVPNNVVLIPLLKSSNPASQADAMPKVESPRFSRYYLNYLNLGETAKNVLPFLDPFIEDQGIIPYASYSQKTTIKSVNEATLPALTSIHEIYAAITEAVPRRVEQMATRKFDANTQMIKGNQVPDGKFVQAPLMAVIENDDPDRTEGANNADKPTKKPGRAASGRKNASIENPNLSLVPSKKPTKKKPEHTREEIDRMLQIEQKLNELRGVSLVSDAIPRERKFIHKLMDIYTDEIIFAMFKKVRDHDYHWRNRKGELHAQIVYQKHLVLIKEIKPVSASTSQSTTPSNSTGVSVIVDKETAARNEDAMNQRIYAKLQKKKDDGKPFTANDVEMAEYVSFSLDGVLFADNVKFA